MRKTVILLSALALVFAMTASAPAAGFKVGAKAGVALPMGYLDALDTGISYGAAAELMLTDSFGVEGEWISSSNDAATGGGEVDWYRLTGSLKTYLGFGPVQPYIKGGFGLYSGDFDDEWGVNGGAGLAIAMGPFLEIGAEGTFHYLFVDNVDAYFMSILGTVGFVF